MPPRIIPILARLRQDITAALSKETIEEACRQEKYSWRKRLLDPATTVYLFLLQVLHGNTACQHVVHFGCWTFTDSAYCQARKRLPLAVFHWLLEKTAAAFRSATSSDSRWLGHRVWLVDGSSFSMPDDTRIAAPLRPARRPAQGLRLPRGQVAGAVRSHHRHAAPLRDGAAADPRDVAGRGDLARAGARRHRAGGPGILLVRPSGAADASRAAWGVPHPSEADRRLHARASRDGGAGRRIVPGLPRSRWVLAQGESDQVVVWFKPKKKPSWMEAEEYAELPEEITVRELRYRVEVPGYRVREVTLVTTLLDAATYPASALAELYYRRWQVEINFRHIKISMKMDVLRCETVDGVLKELAVFALAYNLVRSVMVESARLQGVEPDRVELGRRGALADRRGGGGRVGVGGQPIASGPGRAPGGETKAEAIYEND